MLATLLHGDEGVRTLMLEELGLAPDARVTILTQRAVWSGRIDLEMRLDRGAPRVVWIEAKHDAREGPSQLQGYAEELITRYPPGDGQLVALARAGDPLLDSAHRGLVLDGREVADGAGQPLQTARALTWQRVADLIDSAGRETGGARWRLGDPSALSSRLQCDRRDFVTYLERERLSMPNDPVTLVDGIVAFHAEDLLGQGGRIDQLLDGAIAILTGYAPGNGWPKTASYLSAWRGRDLLSPAKIPALQELDSTATWTPTLFFAPTDRWERDPPLEQPYFAAGWHVASASEDLVTVLADSRAGARDRDDVLVTFVEQEELLSAVADDSVASLARLRRAAVAAEDHSVRRRECDDDGHCGIRD